VSSIPLRAEILRILFGGPAGAGTSAPVDHSLAAQQVRQQELGCSEVWWEQIQAQVTKLGEIEALFTLTL
jgi:hypothetical protein